MTLLSFKQYLTKLDEDLQSEIDQISTKMAQIDAQINQRTAPLLQQKQQLSKQLALKAKQKELEDQRTGANPNIRAPQQAGQPAQAGSQTTTPGGGTSATPGGGVA